MLEEGTTIPLNEIVVEKDSEETKKEKKGEKIIQRFTREDGDVDVEKMAEKMNTISEQNLTFKKIFLFSSLFLLVMIALMVSSNV